jgi:hypothetical protein
MTGCSRAKIPESITDLQGSWDEQVYMHFDGLGRPSVRPIDSITRVNQPRELQLAYKLFAKEFRLIGATRDFEGPVRSDFVAGFEPSGAGTSRES